MAVEIEDKRGSLLSRNGNVVFLEIKWGGDSLESFRGHERDSVRVKTMRIWTLFC